MDRGIDRNSSSRVQLTSQNQRQSISVRTPFRMAWQSGTRCKRWMLDAENNGRSAGGPRNGTCIDRARRRSCRLVKSLVIRRSPLRVNKRELKCTETEPTLVIPINVKLGVDDAGQTSLAFTVGRSVGIDVSRKA